MRPSALRVAAASTCAGIAASTPGRAARAATSGASIAGGVDPRVGADRAQGRELALLGDARGEGGHQGHQGRADDEGGERDGGAGAGAGGPGEPHERHQPAAALGEAGEPGRPATA